MGITTMTTTTTATMTMTWTTTRTSTTASQATAESFNCFPGKGCTFDTYGIGKHYKVHEEKPGMSKASCRAACLVDNDCEAFEVLGAGMKPSCTFWMSGACQIGGATEPDGFLEGIGYLETCEKEERKP